MKEKMMELKSKMKPWHIWSALILIFAIIATIIVLNMDKENYKTLYAGLTTEDKKDIEKYLSQNQVDYKIDEDSGTISVKEEEVSSIKMELANQGLPGETNPGFELLDETSIGSTKDDREMKYKRALKGQIEKDLVNGIDGIEKATVHFDIPEDKNIFVSEKEEDEESKATVTLKLSRGTELEEEQIKGIQHIVSAAIEGMKSENVVIVDSTGQVISDMDTTTSSNGKQSEIVIATENRIKKDILDSLNKVFGPDSVQVTVRAEINFDEIVRNIEKYDPEGTLVSRHSNKERSGSIDGNANQTVGTETNVDVPEYQMEDGTNGLRTYDNKDEIIENFEVGKTIETIKKNPELQYLSVSVAVNQNMDEEEIEELQNYVAVASGVVDKDRDGELDNGTVRVTPFVFKVEEEKEKEPAAEKSFFEKNQMVIYIAGGIVILLIIILVIILRKLKEKKEMENLQANLEEEERLRQKEMELRKLQLAEQENAIDDEVRALKENLNKEAFEAAEENPKRTAEYVSKLIRQD